MLSRLSQHVYRACQQVLVRGEQSQLVRKTLLTMALRVALVVLSSALFSYLYLINHQESLVKEQLSTYVNQRSQQASEIFRLAQDRHALLKQAALEQLQVSQSPGSPLQLQVWPDGTQRNFPSNRPLEQFDSQHQPAIFLGSSQPLLPELKHRLQVFQALVTQYGPAWRDRFTNLYMLAPENAALVYWPEVPGPLMVPGEFDIHDEPFFYLSDRAHNPNRTTAWSEVYHDPASPDWIISAVTPIDSNQGEHLGTIGHDVILNQLIEKTNRDRLHGSQNVIFSPEGQLIVHPQFGAEIQTKNEALKIKELANPHLSRIFHQVVELALASDSGPATQLIENTTDREFLAVAQLEGPGWYWVTIYPQALLAKDATAAAQLVIFSGILSLLVETTLLYRVIKREVATPLNQLVGTTEQLAQGEFFHLGSETNQASLLQERPDEIGQLSRAFDGMAQQLQDLFAHQESRIEERTAQLRSANQKLEHLSRCDGLTQLANRRCFDETLTQALHRQQRDRQPLTLLMCDIDYFKQYNDHYGHLEGDKCLQTIAQHLQSSTRRAADLSARYGGEEFAMILPATSTEDGLALGEKLCDRILQAHIPHASSPTGSWVTISIGVATSIISPQSAAVGKPIPAETIIAAADQALYQAKQQGRNRAVLAQPIVIGGEATATLPQP